MPNLLPHPLIQILSFCSDFDPDYNNCPTAWPLTFIPEDPLGLFSNGYVTDSMVFLGDTIGPNSNVSFLTLPLQFQPYIGPTGVSSLNAKAVKVFPNPVHTKLNITLRDSELDEKQIIVKNSIGQIVLENGTRASRFEIDVALLHPGVYTLRISTDQGITHSKFLKL